MRRILLALQVGSGGIVLLQLLRDADRMDAWPVRAQAMLQHLMAGVSKAQGRSLKGVSQRLAFQWRSISEDNGDQSRCHSARVRSGFVICARWQSAKSSINHRIAPRKIPFVLRQ